MSFLTLWKNNTPIFRESNLELTYDLRGRSLEQKLELGPFEDVVQCQAEILEPHCDDRHFFGERFQNSSHSANSGDRTEFLELISFLEDGINETTQIFLENS